MLFNSLSYLLFLFTVYLLYRLLQHRQQNILLLIASYFFYACWDLRFLSLIVISAAVNYWCGIAIRYGNMSKKERLIPSSWIILFFFFSILIQWNLVSVLSLPSVALGQLAAMTSMKDGWYIFLVICLAILLGNLLWPQILSLVGNRKRPFFLFIGITINLLLLGFFKYFNFFIDNVEWLLIALGADPGRFHLGIILPVGISFYTFKGIGYLVDVNRGEVEPEKSYTDFALFIGFFPALLAGPIDRARHLLAQITNVRTITGRQTLEGLHLFFYGLFKKIVIADGVVRTVSSVYNSTGQASWIDVIVATFLFTIQIYCDFSGYTDMARGTAKLFGFDLMVNFNLPYFSKNPREFWSRWHISLSTWLRDYLYIPLGGNRLGTTKTYRNLMVTMTLGGLWHGASWNFILWGFFHGLVLCCHRAMAGIRHAIGATGGKVFIKGLKMCLFFLVTCYGWLLFRAPSLDKILNLSSTLVFDFGNIDFGAAKPRASVVVGLPVLLCIEMIEYASGGALFYQKLPIPIWTALYALLIFALILGMTSESTQFIYFNF